jgi:hypothetical protein
MAIVGALSSDPRLVMIIQYSLEFNFLKVIFIKTENFFKYTPQYLGLFKNSGVPPKRKLTKFMISPNAVVQVKIKLKKTFRKL